MARSFRAAAALAIALLACGGTEGDTPEETPAQEDESFAKGGADANAAETDVQLVVSSLVSSSSPDTVGVASVTPNATDVQALFFPRLCVQLAHDAATRTAKFTFTGCVGPSGLRELNGVVVVRYFVEPGHAKLDISYERLAVNDARIEGTASADIIATGARRTMTWKADLHGTTAGGRAFARVSNARIGWTIGEPCLDLDGTSEGQVENRRVRITISDFRRCRRGCPEAGGKIVVTNLTRNVSVQILFDGTNRATYINTRGVESTIPLLCRA
jgi:hypothetical protein